MTSSDFSVEGTASAKDEMGGALGIIVEDAAKSAFVKAQSVYRADHDHFPLKATWETTSESVREGWRDIAYAALEGAYMPPLGTQPEPRQPRDVRSALAAAPSRDQVTMGALRDIETQAWECDKWPVWLHNIVDRTNDVADRLDMSAEQAIAYAVLASLSHPSSLVPTAEQGVVLPPAREATWGDSGPVPGVDFGDEFATPPIAGAGEEPVGWRWRLNEFDPWQFTDGPEWQGLGLPTSFEAKASKEPVYSAVSLSQLYSRIGELEAEVARLTPLAVAYDYLEAPDAIDWKARAEAAEAELAEARELDELAKRITWELSWGERDPNWEGGECCWLVHERSGNTNDREWSLIGYGTTPAEALRRARSFHSPKEPGPAGGADND